MIASGATRKLDYALPGHLGRETHSTDKKPVEILNERKNIWKQRKVLINFFDHFTCILSACKRDYGGYPYPTLLRQRY